MTSSTTSTPRVDVHLTADDLRAALRSDADRGLRADAEGHPAEVVLRRPRLAALRRHHAPARVLPDALRAGDPRRARAHEIAAVTRRRHARRARVGHVRQDADPARRVARRGHDHALRAVRRQRADAARRGRGGEPRVPVGRGARGRRRLRAPPRLDSRRRPPAGGVPRRHDRQPAAVGPRRVPPRDRARASGPTTTCCSASTSSRTSTGSKPPTTTARASPPRSTRTCSR